MARPDSAKTSDAEIEELVKQHQRQPQSPVQIIKTNWPLLMAGVVVITTPTIVLFLLIQRYFWPEGHRL